MYPVTSGVPQGGVLSPLLFIIYTREIPSVLSVSTRVEAVTYADDIKVYGTYCETEKNIVTNALKTSLQKLLAWASLNGIHVNLSKSACMTISKKILDRSSLVDYFHSGLSLPRPTVIRDLGLLVNPRLGSADYIEVIQRKALQKMYLLFRNVRHANKDVYLKLYKAYIVPQLEYASQVWSPYLRKEIRAIEKVQVVFTRILFYRLFPDSSYPESLPSYSSRLQMYRIGDFHLNPTSGGLTDRAGFRAR
ncbi:hypothetical protein Y032_0518g2821 [Ancylostoma ceylanicum]|uniref:Reverse transcriptase domain-containing protein n=1 Tax=Ancylostoma ceylanicum TaxID=53326 RepID=A0A016WU44_9BILA|nr:hypothetical protein Y032_0518g2821 [Ancylostoma ceylanicum]